MKVTRRKFLALGTVALGAAGLGGAGYSVFWEPRQLRVERTVVTLPGMARNRPVRILQLSDLHRSSVVPLAFIEEAIQRGLALDPDLILLTGDYITAGFDTELTDYARVFARASRARPTFAVMGNHDGIRFNCPPEINLIEVGGES
jgi:uncharacterized protein